MSDNDKPVEPQQPDPDNEPTEVLRVVESTPADPDTEPTQVMPVETGEPEEPAAEDEPVADADEPVADADELASDADEPAAAEPAADDEPEQAPAAARAETAGAVGAWQRLRTGMRPSRGQAIVGVVLGLVAFMAVVQVRLNLADEGYAN
ncbi:MAG TPA: hypothetical protein VGJ44_28870, partial [Kribbellaceae bacterium]